MRNEAVLVKIHLIYLEYGILVVKGNITRSMVDIVQI